VMAGGMNKVRFVDTIHVAQRPDVRIRFN
jgi:hypothetical protein